MVGKFKNLIINSLSYAVIAGLSGLLLLDISCSGCRQKANPPDLSLESSPLELKDKAKTRVAPPSPFIRPSQDNLAPRSEQNVSPPEKPLAQQDQGQKNEDIAPPSNEEGDRGSPTGPDSQLDLATGNSDSVLPTSGDADRVAPFVPFVSNPLPARIPQTFPSGDTANLPVNSNHNFFANNSPSNSGNNLTPPSGANFPVAATPNNIPMNQGTNSNPNTQLPLLNFNPSSPSSNPVGDNTQAKLVSSTGPDGSTADAPLKNSNAIIDSAPAPTGDTTNTAPQTDTEMTVAMAEGVLGSAPESAAMGGGYNYSELALAFPEESSEARKTKISQGDKSYDLNLPDNQERYKAEIPLTWVLWAVTAGDISKAVLPDGTINQEEYAKLQFGEVEQPLNGSQEGRLVRIFSCGPLTTSSWNQAWMSMYFNVMGTVPPPPTLADLCSTPTYRDYRISGDKVSFDLPIAGRGALIFVTFNPVDWLKPEFQAAVGAKHIDGEPIPFPPENFKATIEKGELIRAVGL